MQKKRSMPLSLQEEKFVENYLRHGNGSKAAKQAGYSPSSSAETAKTLLKRPRISELIAKAKKKSEARAAYNYDIAMTEAKDGMDLAKETGNAGAFVNGAKLRAQLSGLLVEKHQVQAGFSVQIAGINDEREVEPAQDIAQLIGAVDLVGLIGEKENEDDGSDQ
jgi:phage terminase small subunit